jgi:hypothetical protein
MINTLTRNQQWLIAGLLLLVMLLTRSHFISHIQDASWAIFFMLGFYLRSYLAFPVFWLAAFAIDLVVINVTGSGNFCFTLSYPFLIPAYAAMWFAGRWLAGHYHENWHGVINLISAAILGTIVCQLLSSGGFYGFSGRFAEPSLSVFITREMKFLPMYLQTTLFYLSIATVIHLAVIQAGKFTRRSHS